MKYFCIRAMLCLVLTSCTVTHNIPENQTPNEMIQHSNFKVFVDQNGDFYPDNWKSDYGSHPRNASGKRGAYSLTVLAERNNRKEDLNNFRKRFLSNISENFKEKEKIYIIIHGFNNDESTAKSAYSAIQNRIEFDLKRDGLIEFYWDGLVAEGPIESFDIWFNATGYSQLAGERALRSILNILENKEIIIISHSRGASVVLSSLSDPPYNQKFAKQTFEFHKIKIQNQPELAENNNNIKVIMLAPAIGEIDFKKPEYYTSDKKFRSFSGQVKSIQVTVNKDDKILKKYVDALSDKFNPTDLGYNIKVFNALKKNYSILEMTSYNGLNSHNFLHYISDNRFKSMLENIGVKIQKD